MFVLRLRRLLAARRRHRPLPPAASHIRIPSSSAFPSPQGSQVHCRYLSSRKVALVDSGGWLRRGGEGWLGVGWGGVQLPRCR